MANFTTPEIDQLVKRIRSQSIIIGALMVAIILITTFLLVNGKQIRKEVVFNSAKFRGPVLENVALNGIDNYDKATNGLEINDSKGVLYDTTEIIDYIRTVFPDIIKRHESVMAASATTIPAGYKWKLAFRWNVGQDGTGKNKMNFYVIPMLTDGSKVLDYFRTDNLKYYDHPKKDTDPSNIYNEGQLWP